MEIDFAIRHLQSKGLIFSPSSVFSVWWIWWNTASDESDEIRHLQSNTGWYWCSRNK